MRLPHWMAGWDPANPEQRTDGPDGSDWFAVVLLIVIPAVILLLVVLDEWAT